MKTKLTLTMDKTIIVNAKSFARNTGRSLSELIENYLEKITQESERKTFSSKLEKIVGSVNLPSDFNKMMKLENT